MKNSLILFECRLVILEGVHVQCAWKSSPENSLESSRLVTVLSYALTFALSTLVLLLRYNLNAASCLW